MALSAAQIKALKGVFFDLDGTLIRVEMQQFIPAYLDGLATSLGDGVRPAEFRAVARMAIHRLLTNRRPAGSNREQFVGLLQSLQITSEQFDLALADFCENGLEELRPLVTPIPDARRLLDLVFTAGRRVVIATNPVFPAALVQARLEWGGLADYPFDLITDWDNCGYCKPAPGYFQGLLQTFGLEPEQALMVGNDTGHDLAAGRVGIPTFLIDTWLVERDDGSPPPTMRGNHSLLAELLGKFG